MSEGGFNRGDVVRLRSDGPKMTAVEDSDSSGTTIVTWFDASGHKTTDFKQELLEKVVEEEPPGSQNWQAF